MTLEIACQEQLIPGGSLEEKFETAQKWGFDSIELRGKGEGHFKSRLPELKRALDNGVQMKSLCVEMLHFVCDFDSDLRADALVQMTQQLETFAEVGGRVVVTPASYGLFSRRLPPFIPPRLEQEDQEILLESFGILAEKAEAAGILIAIEPLNRYEDYLINTIADAVKLIEKLGSRSLKICADTYHMNIEESDPLASLRHAKDHIAHIQLSDSNRLEPGQGHINFRDLFVEISTWNLAAPPAFECRLSAEAELSLPASTRFLRSEI